jgi:DNA-binding PadR family transcriptional regulator
VNPLNLLSGQDEIFLLVILQLKNNAYGTTIRREISKVTGKDWSIGAVYDPLYRLEKKGLVESFLSRPIQERGGRSKRMFRVCKQGLEALEDHKTIRDRLWQEVEQLNQNLG